MDQKYQINNDFAKCIAKRIEISKKMGYCFSFCFEDFKILIGYTGTTQIPQKMIGRVNEKFNEFLDVCPSGKRFKIGEKNSRIYFDFETIDDTSLKKKKQQILDILLKKSGLNQTEIQEEIGMSNLTRKAIQELYNEKSIVKDRRKYYLNNS